MMTRSTWFGLAHLINFSSKQASFLSFSRCKRLLNLYQREDLVVFDLRRASVYSWSEQSQNILFCSSLDVVLCWSAVDKLQMTASRNKLLSIFLLFPSIFRFHVFDKIKKNWIQRVFIWIDSYKENSGYMHVFESWRRLFWMVEFTALFDKYSLTFLHNFI